MSNKYSTTIFFNSSPSTIYSFYTDVANWKSWDNEIEYSSLDQSFTDDSQGTIKPKGNSALIFTLKNVRNSIGFDQEMSLPFGSKFILTRKITQLESGSEVTHAGYFTGIFGLILGFFLKIKYSPLLEKSVYDLKKLCESKK